MKFNAINKIMMFLSMCLMVFAACTKTDKNKGYTINGELNFEHNIDSIFIYQYSANGKGKKISAAPVVNNKFTLTGRVDVPQKALFGNMDKNFGGDIILENTDYKITSDEVFSNITGSKIHEKILGFINKPDYQKLVKDYNDVTLKLFENIDMSNEAAVKEAREKDYEFSKKIMDYEDEIFDNIIKDENETTVTKLLALVTSQNWDVYNEEKRLELLNAYEKELGSHINITVEKEIMAKEKENEAMAASVSNGSVFKEIVAKDVNQQPIALSKLVKNNRYTLLEFWASWCSPCRGEIPNLKKAYKKYKSKGLEIYSVSIDEDKNDWLQALKDEQTTWPNTLVVGDEKAQVNAYGIQGIPASYLINSEGVIVASNDELREFELDKTLSKLMK